MRADQCGIESGVFGAERAMSEPYEPGWKPIETAPKDETILLAHFADVGDKGRVGLLWAASGIICPDEEHPVNWIDFEDDDVKPIGFHAVTHWMRLPEL